MKPSICLHKLTLPHALLNQFNSLGLMECHLDLIYVDTVPNNSYRFRADLPLEGHV